jgi:hypothetical protein
MSDIWFRDELTPDPESLDNLLAGVKSQTDRAQLAALRRTIVVYEPRIRKLDQAAMQRLAVSSAEYHYAVVRLGCEFDPDVEHRSTKIGFESASFAAYFQGNTGMPPRVYALAPEAIDKGKPGVVKLKFEPKFSIAKLVEISPGSIEHDIDVGRVAAIVRGFKGSDESEPRWELADHREAPLYGIRHFWLCLEVPKTLVTLTCRVIVDGVIPTKLGGLTMRTSMREYQLRPTILLPI